MLVTIPKFANKTILCVDDDPIGRFYLTRLIQDEGLVAVEASNGLEAIHILEQFSNINYVVLDLEMPVMDGYGFLATIHKKRFNRALKIFVHSSESQNSFLDKLNSIGVPVELIEGYFKKNSSTSYMVCSILSSIISAPEKTVA